MTRKADITFDGLLAQLHARFTAANRDAARGVLRDVQLLIMGLAGLDKAGLIARGGNQVPENVLGHIESGFARYELGEPVHRILGRREFHGLDFSLSPDTLEPRDDTECLIELVLSHIPDRRSSIELADLGTGTGIVGLSLLHELPHARGVLCDISGSALETARANAARLGFADRATCRQGDWLAALEGMEPFDILVSNPPYIDAEAMAQLAPGVAKFDPHAALYGGADGLDAYRIILGDAAVWLKPDGFLAVEIGHDQKQGIHDLARTTGWAISEVATDIEGRDRAVLLRRDQ
ncbi:MAG: peptide chain release factor N(5)-glutamine methyltransferase [Pseudomonadota bacterium]